MAESNNHGFILVLIVALVAIVGIVAMVLNTGGAGKMHARDMKSMQKEATQGANPVGGADGDNIVWGNAAGNADGDNIVWGN
jgi:hypothetical protein